MKIARIEDLYVEAEINERDIHELLGKHPDSASPLSDQSPATAQPRASNMQPASPPLLTSSRHGEIAFVSQPKLKFPIRIVKLDPAAFPRPDGNVFLVRCEFEKPIEKWWRPGMSGLCKVNVEKRTLFWMLTHRTVDFLRMWLWW